MVTVGAEVYPVPPLTITTESTIVPAMCDNSTAPFPPPPERDTAGGAVYPEPPVTMETDTI
jgi:hypothetical protein